MSSAFELLQGATVFTKLDLCNAYHLVQIREGDEWAFNTSTGHFELISVVFGWEIGLSLLFYLIFHREFPLLSLQNK